MTLTGNHTTTSSYGAAIMGFSSNASQCAVSNSSNPSDKS